MNAPAPALMGSLHWPVLMTAGSPNGRESIALWRGVMPYLLLGDFLQAWCVSWKPKVFTTDPEMSANGHETCLRRQWLGWHILSSDIYSRIYLVKPRDGRPVRVFYGGPHCKISSNSTIFWEMHGQYVNNVTVIWRQVDRGCLHYDGHSGATCLLCSNRLLLCRELYHHCLSVKHSCCIFQSLDSKSNISSGF